MTKPATPRPRAAVHSIDHFALHVPSLADARTFFQAFGLEVRRAGAGHGELELRAGDGHRWARILEAERKSLGYLCFNAFADDLSPLRDQVAQAGAALRDVQEDGFSFHDPDGNLILVRIGPRTAPDQKKRNGIGDGGADRRGACTRAQVRRVIPGRLSHVLLFTPDVLRAVDFYAQALGLRLSDKSQDLIAFTHAPHGCDHHLVAFAKSSARGWHHSSWEVTDVNAVGEGAAQMAAAGYAKGWGTGRHVLGSNYFHYVEDPWGSFCEYSADMDFISAGHAWPSGDFAPEDSLYLWGPAVPENFVRNTEA
ncbi:metapyrocatechase [Cupriavidus necator]|uniref:Metapyrocatechase n=1 Tax=Cupriavidus necator TaxID=106590 RepID=A0A1U9V2D6_CUPNE|nr:VOC family protein [Cupriavidus necator]AQV98959.1 metapyrocatechase [Cupriavidus necator]